MGCYVKKEEEDLKTWRLIKPVTALTDRYLMGCLVGYNTGPLRSGRCFVKITFIFKIYFLRL